MRKIKTLFKRCYDTGRVYNEVEPGCEWVLAGEGVPTVKYDGTCCMVRGGRLYRRYDRKLTKSAFRKKRRGYEGTWRDTDFKPAPLDWEPCEPEPDRVTGHWPGWVPVGDEPFEKYHVEAWERIKDLGIEDGTYELVGPKVNNNPYNLDHHQLWKHGADVLEDIPRDFDGLRDYLGSHVLEGIVWHHPDGRMVKLKRRDFGFDWP